MMVIYGVLGTLALLILAGSIATVVENRAKRKALREEEAWEIRQRIQNLTDEFEKNRRVEQLKQEVSGMGWAAKVKSDVEEALEWESGERKSQNAHIATRMIALEKHLGIEWEEKPACAGYVKTKGTK